MITHPLFKKITKQSKHQTYPYNILYISYFLSKNHFVMNGPFVYYQSNRDYDNIEMTR